MKMLGNMKIVLPDTPLEMLIENQIKSEDQTEINCENSSDSESSFNPLPHQTMHGHDDCLCGYSEAEFQKLPDNVKKALKVAQSKANQTDFYQKLQNLNDKLYIYHHLFSKMPVHEMVYKRKK